MSCPRLIKGTFKSCFAIVYEARSEQTPSDFSADKLTFDELEHITRLAKNL